MPDSTLLTPLSGNILLLLMGKLPLKAAKSLIQGILVNKCPSWGGNQAAWLQLHPSLCVVLLHVHNPTSPMLLHKREREQQKGL